VDHNGDGLVWRDHGREHALLAGILGAVEYENLSLQESSGLYLRRLGADLVDANGEVPF
jgi:hypothetical protein